MHTCIDWFARNRVAANFLMFSILLFGFAALLKGVPVEVFPDFEPEIVEINVAYFGATPVEVEEKVTIKIEAAVEDINGIEEITSSSLEGRGAVSVKVDPSYDVLRVLDEVKSRVDAINSFPLDAEKPIVRRQQIREPVITVVLSGPSSEAELVALGENVRDDILGLEEVSQASLKSVRPFEISIEVSETDLRRYGLKLEDIQHAIRRSSVDASAGVIKTKTDEILLRTLGQAYVQEEFEDIVVLSRPDGSMLKLRDIATVVDGFEENALYSTFDGERAIFITIFRSGRQNAIKIAEIVKDYLKDKQANLPAGISLHYWEDRSRIIKARLATLINSAKWGGLLVLLLLSLFLRPCLAFWVFLGIPISFMGAIGLMPWFGLTFNVVSLFAFILVLGIVIDDAIITGESIMVERLHDKKDDVFASTVRGTKRIALPVTFGVLTTVVAFIPLLTMDGARGKIFAQIPLVVIPVLLFSLLESKFVLPSHLLHCSIKKGVEKNLLHKLQVSISYYLMLFVSSVYQPALRFSLRHRYSVAACFVSALLIVGSCIFSGKIRYIYFPRIDDEVIRATLTMEPGLGEEVTLRALQRIEEAAKYLQAKYVDEQSGEKTIQNIITVIGAHRITRSYNPGNTYLQGRSNLGEVMFQLVSPDVRKVKVGAKQLIDEWRKRVGTITGAKKLNYRGEIGHAGSPIQIMLSGPSLKDMAHAAKKVKDKLATFEGVVDVQDTFEDGKQEIKLRLREDANLLGLRARDLANQVRRAFYGGEVQRVQRGKEEVRVMVRYPREERSLLNALESMRIRGPDGVEIPMTAVVDAYVGTGFSAIRRKNQQRAVSVSADIDKKIVNMQALTADMNRYLDKLMRQYSNMRYTWEGEVKEEAETFSRAAFGMLFVFVSIYALLAIPFRSYLQPFLVLLMLPFGVMGGAVLGHVIMGIPISIMSIMGSMALLGVMVNDSLVLVDYINKERHKSSLKHAITTAGCARFRPVFLTSLTTFVGLLPLLFEKSTQAQFLIPMAVSLGYGVLFATFVTLLFLPVAYYISIDLRKALWTIWNWELRMGKSKRQY